MIFCVPGKNYLVFFLPASHGFKVDATLMNSPLSALALMPALKQNSKIYTNMLKCVNSPKPFLPQTLQDDLTKSLGY